MKKLLLAAAALLVATPTYAQEISVSGWVYYPYLQCDDHGRCIVQDPTGTPLIIRDGPHGSNVGTILNGSFVIIEKRVGSYAQIAIDSATCPIAHDVNGSIYCTHQQDGIDPNRGHINHQCLAPDGKTPVACPNEPIGWMRTPDVGCDYNDYGGRRDYTCNPVDHYTDAYQRGELCATYGVPFYDRPAGKPIGLLWGEAQIHAGEKSEDGKWTRIWSLAGQKKEDLGILPYSLKTLRGCG